MPAGLLQGGLLFFVAGDVAFELFGPKFHVGFWHRGDFAAFMAMPKAAVDENHRMPFGQNDVGMAGQLWGMEAVTRSKVANTSVSASQAISFWKKQINGEMTHGGSSPNAQTLHSIY